MLLEPKGCRGCWRAFCLPHWAEMPPDDHLWLTEAGLEPSGTACLRAVGDLQSHKGSREATPMR